VGVKKQWRVSSVSLNILRRSLRRLVRGVKCWGTLFMNCKGTWRRKSGQWLTLPAKWKKHTAK